MDYLKWGSAPGGGNAPDRTVPVKDGCPRDCGLCEEHESAGCCVLLELTKRCNLRCPVCFASAGEGSVEPALSEISALYDMLMERGGPFNIQLSGGGTHSPGRFAGDSTPGQEQGLLLLPAEYQRPAPGG